MKILIVGGGNMGLTFAQSFLRSHVVQKADLMILEKSLDKAEYIRTQGYDHVYSQPRECIEMADLIILAVKPQDCDSLFAAFDEADIASDKVVLSIMAGVTMSSLKTALKTKNVVRAMPNLPSQVGSGMTVFTATPSISRSDLFFIQNLINTTGKSIYVDQEHMIDAATALSGSGPAYVFNFLKIMTEKGQGLGFSESEAELLALQTFKGAIDVFTKFNFSFDEWIQKVASRGGTTEAALNAFTDLDLNHVFKSGIDAAHNRAIELGNK